MIEAMKGFFLIFIIWVVVISGFLYYWKHRPISICLIGDSLAADPIFVQELKRIIPRKTQIDQYGFVGEGSFSIATAMDSVFLKNHRHYDYIIVWCGIDDILKQHWTFHYRYLVQKLSQYHRTSHFILLSPTPCFRYFNQLGWGLTEFSIKYSEFLETGWNWTLEKKPFYPSFNFVNLSNLGNFLRMEQFLSPDGLHLTRKGYEEVVKKIIMFLKY